MAENLHYVAGESEKGTECSCPRGRAGRRRAARRGGFHDVDPNSDVWALAIGVVLLAFLLLTGRKPEIALTDTDTSADTSGGNR